MDRPADIDSFWHRPQFSGWLVTMLIMVLVAVLTGAVVMALHGTGLAVEHHLNSDAPCVMDQIPTLRSVPSRDDGFRVASAKEEHHDE